MRAGRPISTGTFCAWGCVLSRSGTPCALGDRNPVPDGVERPRPHRNVPGRVECPGRHRVLATERHGMGTDDAGVHKGDCLAAESPCCGVREGLPAPVGMMGDASHGIFSRNSHVLAGEEGAGRR